MIPNLILGTHNKKKGRELEELLQPHGLKVQTLADFPEAIEVVEDGKTFADNARRKATQQARHLNRWVLADDSGLEVAALDGAPGVYSARFAGLPADDARNNRLLIEKLTGLPPARRDARYCCWITLAAPDGTIRAEESGECRGRIVESPRGDNGFGYDPLFELREYHKTFGQLGPEVKRTLSHRSRAMRTILRQLVDQLSVY